MRKITFTFLTEEVMDDGTVVKLAGLKLPAKLPVIIEFNKAALITHGTPKLEEGVLKCYAELPDSLLDFYPCAGLSYDSKLWPNITEFKLLEVSMSRTPNADKTIKTLREQWSKSL